MRVPVLLAAGLIGSACSDATPNSEASTDAGGAASAGASITAGFTAAGQPGTGGSAAGMLSVGPANGSAGTTAVAGVADRSSGGADGSAGGGAYGVGGESGGGGATSGAGGADAGPAPVVRPGCESVTHDGHLYALCRDAKVAFPQARKACEAMHMQLIRLDNAAESAWIYETFYAKPAAAGPDGSQMWVGATDNQVEGEWRWLMGGDVFWSGKADGKPVGGLYSNWGRAHGVGAQDQPNDSHSAEGEDCLVIRGPSEQEAGHWTDIGCGAENSPPVPQARVGWYSCEQR